MDGVGAGWGGGRGVAAAEESFRNDVCTAAEYGDLEKLQRLVEVEGCSVSEPDGFGYHALQWAALNNRTAAAQYIVEHGGDVNAADYTGQTALHWSAVRGAVQAAELLLEEGARVDATDCYGYQATHVAAQYGQTAFLYHIVTKWNADPDVPDNDGRSLLHWAAYKGFADCVHLLLSLNAYRGHRDKEGCTPLHWAATRGNLEAWTALVQAGKKEDLMVTDRTGFTPAQLASDNNHRAINPTTSDAGVQVINYKASIDGFQQDSSFNLEVCQLCEKPSHTAIGCPWMYSNCKMPGCKGLMMLLRSERSMTKGIKYLKCQFLECEGFQWLDEAMTQAHASVGSSSWSSRMCYHCREYDHCYKQCPWNGCPCPRFVCNGSIYVHESQREWSMGKKFLKCDGCGKFEWLMEAMAKEEGQIQASIRRRGGGHTNPIMVHMEVVPVDELCKDFIGKNNLKQLTDV